jgi:HK97 family phage portal protein
VRSPLRAIGSLVNRTPVPYVSSRVTLAMPWAHKSGAEAQMRAMGTVGTLFAIVNRTSNATALVKWKLWRKAASGRAEDRVEVTAHAALDLWNKPNPFMPRQEFVEGFQQHVDLTGEGWWVIARNGRSPLPLELWPVRPDRIQPVPHPTDFISGYVYTGPGGEQIPLDVKDVIQLRMPNPLDPYRGMGPVQSVLTDLDATKYSAEWNRSFFLNSAEPGGIIEVPNGLSDTEFDELRDRWNEQHQGVANAHRVAILEHGTWKDRKMSQKDMQFVQLRDASSKVIREAFGISKTAIGDFEDINRATAIAAKAWFAEQITIPRLERIKSALNNDLLPLYGPDTARTLEFDYEDPVPPDAEARNAELTAKASAAKVFIDAGFAPRSVTEALELPDMQYTGTPAPAPAAPARQAPATARLDIHHHTPVARARSIRPLRAQDNDEAEDDDEQLDTVREQHADALAQLLDDWDPIAEQQYTELADQIEQAVDAGDPAALAGLTVDSDDATRVLRLALGAMATTAAEQMAAEAAAQGVKVRPPKVDAGLRNAFGSELVEIAMATAAFLGADIAASAGREALRLFTPGAAGRQVAEQVTGFLRGLKNWFRRDQLAGALHQAQNTGRIATLEAAPVATYRATEVNDSNQCDPCKAIDGTEFATLADAREAYGNGGYQLCAGGIRCRGTVTAVWE